MTEKACGNSPTKVHGISDIASAYVEPNIIRRKRDPWYNVGFET